MAEFGAGVEDRIDRFIMGVVGLSQAQAGRIESHMKANAPWTDRTTNARNGLYSTVRVERGTPGLIRIVIDSGHGVSYGVYLERNNGGRYAIVQPTIDFFAPDLFRQIRSLRL